MLVVVVVVVGVVVDERVDPRTEYAVGVVLPRAMAKMDEQRMVRKMNDMIDDRCSMCISILDIWIWICKIVSKIFPEFLRRGQDQIESWIERKRYESRTIRASNAEATRRTRVVLESDHMYSKLTHRSTTRRNLERVSRQSRCSCWPCTITGIIIDVLHLSK